jgi:hypothetical protein
MDLFMLAGPHPRSSFDKLRTTLSSVEGSLALGGAASPRFPPAPRAGRRRCYPFNT